MTKRQYMTKVDGKIKIGNKHQAKIPDLVYRYNVPNDPNYSVKTEPTVQENLQKKTDLQNKNIIEEHFTNSVINYVINETNEKNVHTEKSNVKNNNTKQKKKKNKENNKMKVKIKKKLKKKK